MPRFMDRGCRAWAELCFWPMRAPRTAILAIVLFTATAAPGQQSARPRAPQRPTAVSQAPGIRAPLKPDELPTRLPGVWKVSLCINDTHAWLRFENQENGTVRSFGRYQRGVGGWWDEEKQRWLYPHAPVAGVYCDMEQKYEPDVRAGKSLLLSVLVKNPKIYRGIGDGFGHGWVRNNCITFARDAWYYYSREWYPLPSLHAPGDLLVQVLKQHPEVLQRDNNVERVKVGR